MATHIENSGKILGLAQESRQGLCILPEPRFGLPDLSTNLIFLPVVDRALIDRGCATCWRRHDYVGDLFQLVIWVGKLRLWIPCERFQIDM